jgi:hypothetical protein
MQSKNARKRIRKKMRLATVDNFGVFTAVQVRDIVPNSVRLTLPYYETIDRAPGVTFDDYQFNLNSIYDPNRTAAGHQPLGYDQWTNFYNRYRVWGCRVKIVWVSGDTGYRSVGMCPTNSTTALVAGSGQEQPNSKFSMLSSNTGMGRTSLSATYDLPRLTGRSRVNYAGADGVAALFGASPGELAILHVFAEGAANIVMTFAIHLEFDVELYDRTELSQS